MKNPFAGLFRARDKPRDVVSAATTFSFGGSSAGKSVTPRNAIQVSVVYACVRVIAETIASLPFGVFQDTKEEATYTIVGSTEADPLNGKLSNETPLAKAIMDEFNGA